MGANLIERHFTLDRSFEGPDHILSSEPDEFTELVSISKQVPLIMGDGTKRIQPNEYDTLLIETVAARLASDTGYAITGSTTLTNAMWQLYEAKIVEARHADASEGKPDEIIANTWLNARA